jgi:hypothetical protein
MSSSHHLGMHAWSHNLLSENMKEMSTAGHHGTESWHVCLLFFERSKH